jgi:hypothetical protein
LPIDRKPEIGKSSVESQRSSKIRDVVAETKKKISFQLIILFFAYWRSAKVLLLESEAANEEISRIMLLVKLKQKSAH